jgi:hypothetical protein
MNILLLSGLRMTCRPMLIMWRLLALVSGIFWLLLFHHHISSNALIVDGLGASDCSYNVLWIILSQATEDFGIKEVNEVMRRPIPPRVPPNGDETGTSSSSVPMGIPPHLTPMVELEGAVANEALKSATRIAGLVRLPPSPLHFPRLKY